MFKFASPKQFSVECNLHTRDYIIPQMTNLSIKKQIDTLFNMIKILSRSNEDAKFDKSLNNGSSKYFLKVNTITDDKIYIVNESPSGLFKGKEELI